MFTRKLQLIICRVFHYCFIQRKSFSIFTRSRSHRSCCFYLHHVLTTLRLLAWSMRNFALFPHLLIIYGVFRITVTFVILTEEGESVILRCLKVSGAINVEQAFCHAERRKLSKSFWNEKSSKGWVSFLFANSFEKKISEENLYTNFIFSHFKLFLKIYLLKQTFKWTWMCDKFSFWRLNNANRDYPQLWCVWMESLSASSKAMKKHKIFHFSSYMANISVKWVLSSRIAK